MPQPTSKTVNSKASLIVHFILWTVYCVFYMVYFILHHRPTVHFILPYILQIQVLGCHSCNKLLSCREVRIAWCGKFAYFISGVTACFEVKVIARVVVTCCRVGRTMLSSHWQCKLCRAVKTDETAVTESIQNCRWLAVITGHRQVSMLWVLSADCLWLL